MQATAGEKTPLALGLDGLRAVQIAHAVYRSCEKDGAIPLGDRGTICGERS